jgi:NAD(P)-dependent dehydrogenase (short-subunit alcohol dehydrogenase family)
MTKTILVTGAGTGFGRLASETLARAGHTVYASMRDIAGRNAANAQEIASLASAEEIDLRPIELDVGSEDSAKAAVDRVLREQGKLDVLVNNAGMLVIGVTEAFTPEQALEVFNTNTISWLRMNRAVLPHMREQSEGLIVYVGSVTSCILSPFQGPYCASKAAGDVLAETMHYENTRYGIDSVIVQPGAYTEGTNHFGGARHAADTEVAAQYDRINDLPPKLASRLAGLAQPGHRTDPAEIAEKIRDVIAMDSGSRPFRIVVDPQHHGAEEVNAVRMERQREFMRRFGIDDLMLVANDAAVLGMRTGVEP